MKKIILIAIALLFSASTFAAWRQTSSGMGATKWKAYNAAKKDARWDCNGIVKMVKILSEEQVGNQVKVVISYHCGQGPGR